VALAAGSTFAGLGALIPAAAAAAYPFVHALNERLKAGEEIKKNRLFFLYDLERRVRKHARKPQSAVRCLQSAAVAVHA
jgi:hypothetical protein